MDSTRELLHGVEMEVQIRTESQGRALWPVWEIPAAFTQALLLLLCKQEEGSVETGSLLLGFHTIKRKAKCTLSGETL